MLMAFAPVSIGPRSAARWWTGPMMFAGLTLIGFAVVRFSGLDHAGVTFCYFKSMTGHACMTCGSTRAFGYLSRFDLNGAFAVQPLVTAGTLGLLAWGLTDTILAAFGKRTSVKLGERTRHWMTLLVIGLAAANWVYLLATGV